MKWLNALFLLISLAAFQAQAVEADILPDNKSCRQVYNEAYLELRSATFQFNDGNLGSAGYSSKVVAIDAHLNSVRAVCLVIESPKNAKCVEVYKKRYKALRREIKITSILLGNQTSVEPDIIETIGNEFSTLYYQLKCGDLNL